MNRPFKTIRHLLLLLATAAAALCPSDVWADEISYLHQIGQLYSHAATVIENTSGDLTIDAGTTSGWYYVSGDVTISGKLMFSGYISIILCDGATLTVTSDIIANAEHSSLNFYAQSSGSEMGKLRAGNICKGDYTYVDCSFRGGDIVLTGGFDGSDFGFYGGHFTAPSIKTSINCELMYNKATDWIYVDTYTANNILKLESTMMVDDDPTNTISKGVVDASAINGKKLSVPSGSITPISVATGITDGTVAINVSQVVDCEYVTATFTPATGYILTGASYTDDNGTHSANASDVANIRSSGRWNIWIFRNGTKSAFTVTATFAPIVASITSGGTTTYFPTLAEALGAVPKNLSTTTTIDVVRDIEESGTNFSFSGGGYYDTWDVTLKLNGKGVNFGNIANLQGSMSIEDLATGSKKSLSLGQLSMLGNLYVTNATVNCKYISDWADNDEDNKIELDKSNVVCRNDGNSRSLNWGSRHIVLKNGSQLTLYDEVYLGHDNFEFDIQDNSWIAFNRCIATGYRPERLKEQIAANVKSGISIALDGVYNYVTMTTGGDPSTTTAYLNLVLRGTWSLELKNGLNEISAGVPSATVQYFDGGTTAPKPYDPDDDTSFRPANYPDANEITAINNSDGQDHYIIMHIVPHKGDIADPDDPDYWTNERLLYVMEGASAASRSRGPGISLNLPYLLKADEYDANLDPTDPDMQPRHDGAGWYYYKLPASHNVANGYTKSTLQGLAAPVFDLENVSLTQNLETGVVTLSRTTDAWTAELTYDRLHWPFIGTIDDTDKPKLKKLVMKYGGSSLITLDTTPASENPSDEAKAAAAQAEINAQITHNYPFGQASLEWNQQQIGSATAFGWFKRYSDDSYFWIDVPFTPLTEPTTTNPAGSANNPWLIRNADELNMLSKCLTVGYWNTENKYLRQTDNIDMSGITDFLPIGVRNPGPSFLGHYDGFGNTISNLSVTYSTALNPLDPTEAYVGLFGLIEGNSDAKASVENVTLKNCSFSATAGSSAVAVGGIAGMVEGSNPTDATISNCKVLGSTEVCGLPTGCATGAIVGSLSVGTLSHNYYGYGVTVTNASGTAEGYTKRGLWMGTVPLEGGTPTYKWTDFSTTTNVDGAVLWVKKAKLPDATTSGSTVAFRQTTTPADADATHPADCYSFSGNNYYYAVDQPVTLSVTTGSASPDGVRTFYDELETLTMKDGTADTDIKDALGFTMPGTDVTIEATFTPSDWFTINTVNYNATDPSQPFDYNWMTFYHEWTDGTGTATTPANYKVTNYDDPDDPTKAVEVKTVSRVNPADGSFALADIKGGICYSGVPTIFHYAVDNDASAVLPQKLKFTPVDPTVNYTEPTVAAQFKGTVSGKTLTASDKCYILNNAGDFILAYPTEGDDQIAAHKCYIDWNIEGNGNTPAPARLVLTGGNTGIERILLDGSSDGDWYSLDGRRLNGQPARKGIYIYKGKKTVIK